MSTEMPRWWPEKPRALTREPKRRRIVLSSRRHTDSKGTTTKVEAKDEDLDMLTDAVYQALVSYHKRKVGYLQVCKYLFFTVVMMVMFMMQSQITADMHGQAQLIKETLLLKEME